MEAYRSEVQRSALWIYVVHNPLKESLKNRQSNTALDSYSKRKPTISRNHNIICTQLRWGHLFFPKLVISQDTQS